MPLWAEAAPVAEEWIQARQRQVASIGATCSAVATQACRAPLGGPAAHLGAMPRYCEYARGSAPACFM